MKGIVAIIKDTDVGKRNEKVLEFDLNVLEESRCRQLEEYVN
jgi:Bromodomain extra-terminal - transcription regulation